MCEIAVFNTESVRPEAVQQVANNFYSEQGDGLGLVMVLNEGDKFRYETYKSTDPHWGTVFSFIKRYWDRSWRVVVHGRNATSGQVNRRTAHPLRVECQQCEFDHIVHNGSVRKYEEKQTELWEDGHYLNTLVDSEVIAHKVGSLPESVEDLKSTTYNFYGNLNYILFSEDGIFVRSDDRYHLSDDFTMTCSPEIFRDAENAGFDESAQNGWALVTPDGSSPAIETKQRVAYKRRRAGNSGGANWVASGESYRDRYTDDTEDEEEDAEPITIEYKDLSHFESLTVVMVAPGVLKVIDDRQGEVSHVWRDKDPKTYYYYVPEQQPDDVGNETRKDQSKVGDFQKSAVQEAVHEEVSTTIASEIDEVTIRDVAEINDELRDAIGDGAEAALNAHE